MDDATVDAELELTQEAKVGMSAEVEERKPMKLEALQLFEQGSRAMNNVVVERHWQLMVDLQNHMLSSMGASTSSNMPSRGPINQKQQIGAKRGATLNISQ